MNQAERISYVLIAVLFTLIGLLHLPTLLLTILFGYFALRLFSFRGSKTIGLLLYVVAIIAIGYGLFYFGQRTYDALPEIAEKTIPAVTQYAERHNVELPFTDYDSLRREAVNEVREGVKEGETIARPLAQANVFPPMVTQMIAIGEETGALDVMLSKVSEFYDMEVNTAVDGLTSTIEPALIMFLGVAVGTIVIALYLPIFRVITMIQ